MCHRFYRTVLLPSSNPQAKVQVSVVRINTDVVSSTQIECLNNVFIEPSESHGLISKKTSLGRAMVLDPTTLERNLTFIHIPCGQYDKVKEDIKWYCTLGRLSCIQPARYDQHRNSLLEIQMIPELTANATNNEANATEEESRKCGNEIAREGAKEEVIANANEDSSKEVNIDLNASNLSIDSLKSEQEHLQVLSMEFITKAADQKQKLVQGVYTKDANSPSQLITTVTNLLLTLGYLNPLLETFAPFYCNILLLAVRHFQIDYNEASEKAHNLPTSGHLTPMTLHSMKDLVKIGLDHLQRLGFEYNGPISLTNKKDQNKLAKFISQCQNSLAIEVHMTGTLDSQTREEIRRLVADM